MNEQEHPAAARPSETRNASHRIPIVLAIATVVTIGAGHMLFAHATEEHGTALDRRPMRVTVVEARGTTFRARRRYVGSVEPWVEARLGPQVVAAYVRDVLVRPGDAVARGALLAVLDCRSASASARAVAMEAQAIESRQRAISDEADRMGTLVDSGYVATTEIERTRAQSDSEAARLAATNAQLVAQRVAVSDCALRAPFAGEVGARRADPGAFARPGDAIMTVVDRSTVRVSMEVAETDFEAVAPGTPVHLLIVSTGLELDARISRRSPEADADTRTIHVEIDVPDRERRIPIHTTAAIFVDIGQARPAVSVPLEAASVRGTRATLFIAASGRARKQEVSVIGEDDRAYYLETTIPAGSLVVTQGRTQLHEGDPIDPRRDAPAHGPS